MAGNASTSEVTIDGRINEWIEEGSHLMILAPPAMLENFPTDPHNGGPYVMWKGTPYQHIMVPIGSRHED